MFREPGSSKMSERSASGRDYSGVVGSGLGSLGGPRPEPWFPGLWLRWAPGGRPGGGAGGFRVGGGGGRGAGEAERPRPVQPGTGSARPRQRRGRQHGRSAGLDTALPRAPAPGRRRRVERPGRPVLGSQVSLP